MESIYVKFVIIIVCPSLPNTCRTFGSGVVQPFNGSAYYLRSNCPFTLTRFTHNRVECDITALRGNNGLLYQIEIIINKIRTIVQYGNILVEKKSVTLPYDHTYQHIFQYGIYTKLKSLLLPVSVTWHSVPGGIDTVRVELDQELSSDMTGLCGKQNATGGIATPVCRMFFSYTLDCLQQRTPHYIQLCEENIYSHENDTYISCSFFQEIVQECGNGSHVWNVWRDMTGSSQPCPGDLVYKEQGAAFVPSCSNPNPRLSNQDLTSSCVCPEGKHLINDRTDGFHCVNVASCPCVFGGRIYKPGDIRNTKCQSCVCEGGKWHCSENVCPDRCLIEGQFVTTFDGKQYVVPGKCAYVASQGLNWKIIIQFSPKEASLKTVVLHVALLFCWYLRYSLCHLLDHALVFWQSSVYVQVQTSFGMKIQIQMSPEIELYITLPRNHNGTISGLCGNSNNDTTDDFSTSSGIIENSPHPFALSWTVGTCAVNIPSSCSNADNEIFADEGCAVLNNPNGIFAHCHSHISTDHHYFQACVLRTCNCGSNLQQCLCVALDSYAKACAFLGVAVGDWRKATNCTLTCPKNQEFSYDMKACNHTCRSLAGPDPRCQVDDAPVEGCGCPEGTHLNQGDVCTPKSECVCHHYGGTTLPGPVVIDGRQNGKVCFHCSEFPVNTAQKTCDSLSKPLGANVTCESGCYCPHDQYEDHHGNCVSLNDCTCKYSGKVFSTGQRVDTNCKTCTCAQGQWHCTAKPCPGKCQVYGNGHYQTFDSKWYRFDGHCQYTLVEVRPLTTIKNLLHPLHTTILKNLFSLTLSDMKVTKHLHKSLALYEDALYTTHTVGLYIIISVPSRGITLIWDKHTRITIELHPAWRNRVCGLCGNFDSNEMNDLKISGSAVVSRPMAFGNSWKAATPPCSDVTTERFPCERHSYCSAWAQRRCMIITADIFKECHLKVDPEPYYSACTQESCSCEFEGKFLGFCTAVAAYAEACSEQGVCVNWRTPDLCPVYCDYYNEQGQCSWHYEPCGEMRTCSKGNHFNHKLEGCYPRCPKDAPYYDENTGDCTKLMNCTCYFNDTVIQPGTVVMLQSNQCTHHNHNTSDNVNSTHHNHNTSDNSVITGSVATPVTHSLVETSSLEPTTESTVSTAVSTESTTHTTTCNDCIDLTRKKTWACGEMWTEDCFHKTCINGKIESTPVGCPEMKVPICPRNQLAKVSDGCCETWKCDCRCDLYGDPHYISFNGVPFDFLDECSAVLVEEQSPQHDLSIIVDNFYCVPGLLGSCAKSVILKYQSNVATLSIVPDLFTVQATLNNVTILPPYQEHGIQFETTEYMVSIYLPEVRSYVSLTPSYTLVVNLAMEHFLNNTQGQCVCGGGGSCIRRGGHIEDDSCCDRTAYSWVYADPLRPACTPTDVPCHSGPTVKPTSPPTTCPASPLCHLLDHPVFLECKMYVNLKDFKKHCEFDSCGNRETPCSSLEQAAEECKQAGICIKWRKLTNGTCGMYLPCQEGLVPRECSNKKDDFCYGGVRYAGASFEKPTAGCFCPSGQLRAGNHSSSCVFDCAYCKGPLGEPKMPGDVWQSGCNICVCNNQTRSEECFPKPPGPVPICSPTAILINTSCCGDQICSKYMKNCSYDGKTYKVGDTWKDATNPCLSLSCTKDGVHTETKVCPRENCPEVQIRLDYINCSMICNKFFNITIDNCTTTIDIPVCHGQCVSPSSIKVLLHGDLQVEQKSRSCQELGSERRSVTLQCSDQTTRRHTYKHITSCECRSCGILR
uniref:Mucin 6, oligomeric mucus/gel-forming n=1 Tax=Echeneis naucrates TaxID=173247 RepID=A0A665X7E0_ECHNA